MIIAALGDSELCTCSCETGNQSKCFSFLPNFCVNKNSHPNFRSDGDVLNQFSEAENMATYMDKVESLFIQIDRMEKDFKIQWEHKAPLLPAILVNSSPLHCTFALSRTKILNSYLGKPCLPMSFKNGLQIKFVLVEREIKTTS